MWGEEGETRRRDMESSGATLGAGVVLMGFAALTHLARFVPLSGGDVIATRFLYPAFYLPPSGKNQRVA